MTVNDMFKMNNNKKEITEDYKFKIVSFSGNK